MARSRKRSGSKPVTGATRLALFGTVATNRRARFEYEVIEELEAGIVLTGSEIKSIRQGKADISNSFVRIVNGEAWLHGSYVAPYSHASLNDQHEPTRERKLLLKRAEIKRLGDRVAQAGLTIIVLRLYISHGVAKLGVALARGRKRHDKREAIKRREHDREIARASRRTLR